MKSWCVVPVLALSVGCARMPTQAERSEAQKQMNNLDAVMEEARRPLEFLGILPTYQCGSPRGTQVGKAAEALRVRTPCAQVTTESFATSDWVTMTFPQGGCSIGDHWISGEVRFTYSGGDDRIEIAGDFQRMFVDGISPRATVEFVGCGDEISVTGTAEGKVPDRSDLGYWASLTVALRQGIPIIGDDELALNGRVEVIQEAGVDKVTIQELLYEIGEYLPKSGQVNVETHEGKKVKGTFKEKLWRLGEVEVEVNDSAPVTVPVIH